MSRYTEDEVNALTLDSFTELTYKVKLEVTDNFRRSCPLKKYSDFLIKTVGAGVYNKIRELFFSPDYRASVLDGLERRKISCITYFSDDYPESLRQIAVPPLVLYCKGNAALLKERKFAVVGSRHTLPEVMKRCTSMAEQLAREFAVITGTADGADSAAARGALAGGRLIMIAAQGLDHVYPSTSAELYRRAEAEGLLISEQRPETVARGYLFPVRNRLIAALAEGVLVVSAGEKSGASITAEYAFTYGKDVFSIPYFPGVSSGAGCNRLIKKGAYLTENILDILGAFGLDCTSREQERLTPREQAILSVLRDCGEAHISAIAQKVGCPSFELLSEIASLEVKGLAVRLGGNRYGLCQTL